MFLYAIVPIDLFDFRMLCYIMMTVQSIYYSYSYCHPRR